MNVQRVNTSFNAQCQDTDAA